jgi:hypothetical protein
MECPTTYTSGYFGETRTCGTCGANQKYMAETQSCADLPTCSSTEILQGVDCYPCPAWQSVKENRCIDRCVDGFWDQNSGECTEQYDNSCKQTALLFQEIDEYSLRFDDKCKRDCHNVNLYMETSTDHAHTYYPKGVQCCDGDNCGIRRGYDIDHLEAKAIGDAQACIYRVQYQGDSPHGISSIRYFWMRGQEYSVDTIGDWDHSLPFESQGF